MSTPSPAREILDAPTNPKPPLEEFLKETRRLLREAERQRSLSAKAFSSAVSTSYWSALLVLFAGFVESPWILLPSLLLLAFGCYKTFQIKARLLHAIDSLDKVVDLHHAMSHEVKAGHFFDSVPWGTFTELITISRAMIGDEMRKVLTNALAISLTAHTGTIFYLLFW